MTSLHIDHWQGQSNQGEEIADASEDELAAAIDRLDDWNHTNVSLKDGAGRVLMIGGGPDRFFIQYLLPEDTGVWVAVGDADAEGEEVLTLGRQEADYPKRQIFSKMVALDAGRVFLRDGGRPPTVIWEQLF